MASVKVGHHSATLLPVHVHVSSPVGPVPPLSRTGAGVGAGGDSGSVSVSDVTVWLNPLRTKQSEHIHVRKSEQKEKLRPTTSGRGSGSGSSGVVLTREVHVSPKVVYALRMKNSSETSPSGVITTPTSSHTLSSSPVSADKSFNSQAARPPSPVRSLPPIKTSVLSAPTTSKPSTTTASMLAKQLFHRDSSGYALPRTLNNIKTDKAATPPTIVIPDVNPPSPICSEMPTIKLAVKAPPSVKDDNVLKQLENLMSPRLTCVESLSGGELIHDDMDEGEMRVRAILARFAKWSSEQLPSVAKTSKVRHFNAKFSTRTASYDADIDETRDEELRRAVDTIMRELEADEHAERITRAMRLHLVETNKVLQEEGKVLPPAGGISHKKVVMSLLNHLLKHY